MSTSNGSQRSRPPTIRAQHHTTSSSFGDHSVKHGMMRATTEGWLELFLKTPEKFTFSHWKEEILDKSLTHNLLHPIFEYLSQHIPETVAPNVVSLFGLFALCQAWYITHLYADYYPTACTWLAVVSILLFFITSSIGNYHADRIRQRTALGELFKYSCDAGATVFLSILTTYCLGGTQVETQWYAVQIAQLVLFLKHLSAFHRNAGLRYNVLTGPGEVILIAVSLLAVRATVGLDFLLELYEATVYRFLTSTPALQEKENLEKYRRDPTQIGSEAAMYAYYAIYLVAVTKSLLLKSPHGWSRFGLSASLLMRFLPALLFQLGFSQQVSVTDVICDGIFMAVLTSDVTLAKMAGRELHPWVVLMSMATVLSHTTIIALSSFYYVGVFADLCSYLNMPLLTTCRNVSFLYRS
jgi:hypothetical protein